MCVSITYAMAQLAISAADYSGYLPFCGYTHGNRHRKIQKRIKMSLSGRAKIKKQIEIWTNEQNQGVATLCTHG